MEGVLMAHHPYKLKSLFYNHPSMLIGKMISIYFKRTVEGGRSSVKLVPGNDLPVHLACSSRGGAQWASGVDVWVPFASKLASSSSFPPSFCICNRIVINRKATLPNSMLIRFAATVQDCWDYVLFLRPDLIIKGWGLQTPWKVFV